MQEESSSTSAAMTEGRPAAPHQQSIPAVVAAFKTDARRGLGEPEAEARLRQYGRNELTAEKPECEK
jgi:hypothetical protein